MHKQNNVNLKENRIPYRVSKMLISVLLALYGILTQAQCHIHENMAEEHDPPKGVHLVDI